MLSSYSSTNCQNTLRLPYQVQTKIMDFDSVCHISIHDYILNKLDLENFCRGMLESQMLISQSRKFDAFHSFLWNLLKPWLWIANFRILQFCCRFSQLSHIWCIICSFLVFVLFEFDFLFWSLSSTSFLSLVKN